MKVCDEFGSLCADDTEASCDGIVVRGWEAFLYLLGVCLMIIGSTVLVRDYLMKMKILKVEPE